jgi:hypothetical protein
MGYEPAPRIRPIAPAPSLLTSARPLPTLNWSTGIAWSTGCQPSYALEYCPPAVDRTAADDRDIVHTLPFLVYTPMACTAPVDEADVEQQARDLTETHTAYGIARALWLGEGLPTDTEDNTVPTLRRSAVDVAEATSVDLDDGVAQLLVHYEECTGGQGGAVVHLPAELIVYALGGGAGGARLCWPEGNIYRGPQGSVFTAGPGYPLGRSPHGPFGSGPQIGVGNYQGNEASQSWIYVTGPVEYAVGAVRALPETSHDRYVPRTNLYDVWGERDAIVRFDPCCCFATLVNNPSPMPEVS